MCDTAAEGMVTVMTQKKENQHRSNTARTAGCYLLIFYGMPSKIDQQSMVMFIISSWSGKVLMASETFRAA